MCAEKYVEWEKSNRFQNEELSELKVAVVVLLDEVCFVA